MESHVAGAHTDTPNYLSDYEAALRAAQEASAEALRQSIEQGVNSITGQKDGLKDQYEQAAQQAYIAKMMGTKALPQQLAAQGLTGGATESANLALETNYGNGLNSLTNTYNQGVAQVDKDAANYRATGDISIAQNAAQYQQQMANAALQAAQQQAQLQAQKELAEYNARMQAQQAEAQRQWQAQQNQAGWDWQSQQAQSEYDRNKSMKEWEMQQDYDYWLKKLGAKAARTDVTPPAPKDGIDADVFSKVAGIGNDAANKAAQAAQGLRLRQPVYPSHGGRDLSVYPQDYNDQLNYLSIMNNQSLDAADRARKLQAAGYSYSY